MHAMRSMKFLGGLAFLAVVMGAVALLPPSEDPTLLSEAFFDAGHVPMFLVFALVVLWLARATLPGPPGLKYLVAAVLVVLAGLGTEFVQKFVARDAGWTDFFRDLLGGGAALLLALAVEHRRPAVKVAAVLGALGLVGVGLVELVSVHLDYRSRDAAFPVLAAFEEPWEDRFLGLRDTRLERQPAPPDFGAGSVGRLTFAPADYPALMVKEPFPDWTGHSTLRLRIRAEAPGTLAVRVHDARHDETFLDRFNREFGIEPGFNEIAIPIREIEEGPRSRRLDLRAVRGLALFAIRPADPFTVLLDEVRLD